MTPTEDELLRGMGNCYAACGEDFEHTVGMVARARGLSPGSVKATLATIKTRYAQDADYQALRSRLPHDFPV